MTTTFSSQYKFLRGCFLNALSDESALYLPDGIAIFHCNGSEQGKIVFWGPIEEAAKRFDEDLESIPKQDGLILPAFFDMHFHWVQDAVRSMPKTSLLEWLETYTFPTEGKFHDATFAEQEAQAFWGRIVSTGTIGGLCYSSIHEVALSSALRWAPEDFRIGNVLMTMHCPEFVRQSESEAIASVERCATQYGDRYVASPRFAPTTAPDVMRASASAAQAVDCFQQTHLGETLAEIEWVLEMYRKFPDFKDVSSYTEIYERVGMLGPKTVFGHCIHLSDAEWRLLAESGSIVASCPSSNAPIEELGLGSGLFDFEKADAWGVEWALASDIGGGPFLSMFDVMRSFVSQNEANGSRTASYIQALYRSTRKGAELLGLGHRKGRWEPGYDFDCIRVPINEEALQTEAPEAILRAVVEQVEGRRAAYADLVEETIIRGQTRFSRQSQNREASDQ